MMFDLLKSKLKKVVESLSKKLETKEPEKAKKELPAVEKIEEVQKEEAGEIKPVEIKEEARPEVEETEVEAIPKPRKEFEVPEKKFETIEKKIELPEKKSFFKKVFERVVKKVTTRSLAENDMKPILEELETDLIEADVAVEVAEKIRIDLQDSIIGAEIKRGEEEMFITDSLKRSILEILSVPTIDLEELLKKKPAVILFLGFNGSGKTTSLAKYANWLIKKGYTCIFAAADTFRAASIEQLEEHAKKIGVKVIKHNYGADPAAVVYDAVEHAKAKGIDFVLADTAGRAHTNMDLMEQIKKILRVNKPDLKVLVIDSLTGNDAVLQAQAFGDLGVDAVIFTKVDVNEKGGAILSVTHKLKKPILFLGVGQRYEDFDKFNAEKFVNNILV
jgi:fused signal recognition particle receptor